MPIEAFLGITKFRFSSFALRHAYAAAVSVHVEDMFVGADRTSRRCLKSNREDISSKESESIRERTWLKPHLLVCIMQLILLEQLRVHRRQVFFVHLTWYKKHWVASRVTWKRLVQWIIAKDIWVVGKSCGNMVPKRDEFVLQTVFVREQGTKCRG